MSCIVLGCKSHSSRIKSNAAIISFHRFPVDFNMRQQWIYAIRRSNWQWKKQDRICSRHFEEKYFINISHKWRRLLSNAVPSLHLCGAIDIAPGSIDSDIGDSSTSNSTGQADQLQMDISHYVAQLEEQVDKLENIAKRRLLKINTLRQQTKRLKKKNIDLKTRLQNFLKNESIEQEI